MELTMMKSSLPLKMWSLFLAWDRVSAQGCWSFLTHLATCVVLSPQVGVVAWPTKSQLYRGRIPIRK